jgi:lysophospholipid acyltransferase (LPLAT)-like uncharacterized protein
MGDAIEKDRAPRKRPLRRRLAKVGVGLLTYVVPAIYQSYMWLVYATSRVEHENTDLLWLLRERYGGLVGIMWHQEVFMVAWSFRRFEGHTLASTGDLGDIITAVLQANDFVVLRGGSTKSKSRKRPVLHDMIEHMRSVPGVAFGITCDGSKGPAYRVKKGSIVIAHACSKPMITARTWCKRRINLRGWDRSYIPLPFNHIVQENELLELTYYVHERIGDLPETLDFGFPDGWRPKWGGRLPELPLEAPEGHPALEEKRAEAMGEKFKKLQREAVERAVCENSAHRDAAL